MRCKIDGRMKMMHRWRRVALWGHTSDRTSGVSQADQAARISWIWCLERVAQFDLIELLRLGRYGSPLPKPIRWTPVSPGMIGVPWVGWLTPDRHRIIYGCARDIRIMGFPQGICIKSYRLIPFCPVYLCIIQQVRLVAVWMFDALIVHSKSSTAPGCLDFSFTACNKLCSSLRFSVFVFNSNTNTERQWLVCYECVYF